MLSEMPGLSTLIIGDHSLQANAMHDPDLDNKELYELTTEQATELLHEFLAKEEAVFRELKVDGIELNYSRDSVVEFFKYVLMKEFDKADVKGSSNNIWYLRLAYYFGEALRKASNHLHWAIGRIGSAEENHPVIAGFEDETQAPLIAVARNILVAVAVDGEPFRRIERAVDAWFRSARYKADEGSM